MTKVSVNQRSMQIFRVMLSGIFLVASLSHLFNIEKTLQKLDQARFKGIAYLFGDPTLMIIVSGIAMLLAGLSLMAGFKTKWAAFVLAACLIPITITVQVGQITSLGPLFKNIAIFGGLLFFILNDFNKTQKT
jgi:putative oxidoreductase